MYITIYTTSNVWQYIIQTNITSVYLDRQVAVRRQAATRLRRRLRPSRRPARRPGQGCLWLGNQSVESTWRSGKVMIFVELQWSSIYTYEYIYIYIYKYVCIYIYNITIIKYTDIYWSISWSLLKHMIVNPEVQLGGFLQMAVGSGVMVSPPRWREPSGRLAQSSLSSGSNLMAQTDIFYLSKKKGHPTLYTFIIQSSCLVASVGSGLNWNDWCEQLRTYDWTIT